MTATARDLLLGASVYREPVDTDALLYQIGRDDPDAESVANRDAASEQITTILTQHGLDPTGGLDPNDLPPRVLSALQPHLTELYCPPRPPRSTDADPDTLLRDLAASSLLTVDPDTGTMFVHRWTATELHDRSTSTDPDALRAAQTRAADYWRWRVRVWSQDRDADLHDQLEARHHLLEAGDTDTATDLTETICDRLHTIGAWDYETTLVHDTLTRLGPDSPRRRLPPPRHARPVPGRLPEAERRYTQSLAIFDELGDRAGTAAGHHRLGNLPRGDYREAERRYTQSLAIKEDLGDRAGIAKSWSVLGDLVAERGRAAEAVAWHIKALCARAEMQLPAAGYDLQVLGETAA